MSRMRLYVDWLSQPSRAVVWYARLVGADFDVVEKRIGKGEQRDDETTALNPMKQIPVLVDGDLSLPESEAILRYLARSKKDRTYWPTEPREEAEVDKLLAWYHGNIRRGAAGYGFAKTVAPAFGIDVPPGVVETDLRVLTRALRVLNGWLGQDTAPFLARREVPSAADLLIFCELEQLRMTDYNVAPYAEVDRWMGRMRQVDGYDETHRVFNKVVDRVRAKL